MVDSGKDFTSAGKSQQGDDSEIARYNATKAAIKKDPYDLQARLDLAIFYQYGVRDSEGEIAVEPDEKEARNQATYVTATAQQPKGQAYINEANDILDRLDRMPQTGINPEV